MSAATDRIGRRQGSVLILALWTLFFLGALALAAGSHVSSVLSAARAIKHRHEARRIAESAAAYAVVKTLRPGQEWDGTVSDEPSFRNIPFARGTFSVCYTCVPSDGNGVAVTNFGVVGESGRINLNFAEEKLIRALLVRITESQEVDELAAAMAAGPGAGKTGDRKEVLAADSARERIPYRAAAEILLVSGMTQDVYRRLAPFVTVYGDDKLNVNLADPVVLWAYADAYEAGGNQVHALVEQILAIRQSGSFVTETGLLSLVGFFSISSSAFSGIAIGYSRAGGVVDGNIMDQCRIAFVFDRSGRIRFWHEY